ncbi:MAG TPA: hypothetical protein VJ694_04680 [Patescibacteria group bacterium]|nr:hypothetical protein [Patescibacteria group bacterium]
MKRLLIAAAVLVTLGAGCAKKPQPPAAGAPAGKQAPAARVEDAIFIVDGTPVTMNDGYSIVMDAPDSQAATVTRVFGLPVVADLDGDGDLDAAVELTKDTPGTGTFYYVAAAIKEDWGFRGTETYPLGDRIAPQTLEIHDAVIVANYADRKPGEPMTTQPSVGVSKYFRVVDGQLQETPKP